MGQMRRSRAWLYGGTTAALFFFGCSPKKAEDPGLSIAGSRAAQADLRRLEDQWELRAGPARAELRGDLEDFVRRFPKDRSVARARLMLAQIALMERRLESAEEILQPVMRGARGPTRDEAEVVLAAIDNRRGRHEKALERLAPLNGKLLSREAKDQYARERINAAIASRRWRLTVDAMVAWLAESDNSRHVEEWTEAAIVQVPTRALSRLLADWESARHEEVDEAASDWIHRAIIEHLSREALRARDARLARDLLDAAPPWLRAGKSGDDLSVLAALAEKEARIAGRGIGIVMGGESEVLRRRSARVGMGLVRGLDLGRAPAVGGSADVEMLAAESRGSTSAALGRLTGLGASILIAGFDEDSATEAIVFAETRQVPVIVMHPPRASAKSSYGFFFGVEDAAQIAALDGTELAGKWALVGPGGTPCPAQDGRPTTTTLPWEAWRAEGQSAVLVLGDSTCCLQVQSELAQTSWDPTIVFGLEGAHTSTYGPGEPLRLSVGQYPSRRMTPLSGQMTEEEKAILEGKAPARVSADDWYFSLGVDAARLCSEALKHLPLTQVTDKQEVRMHHEKARNALLDARAPLMTADARGFDSTGHVERKIVVRGLENAK